ncbi:hypothetical protein CGRA01v4_12061 [Colletotrichum graminicola]|nr:hypothetical protein CGRA01v4_12061 [Colletotrichum graminicola]
MLGILPFRFILSSRSSSRLFFNQRPRPPFSWFAHSSSLFPSSFSYRKPRCTCSQSFS